MDRNSLLKLALVAVVVSLIAWLYASGKYEDIDPAQMRAWVQNAGAWGGVLFVGTYACLQPLGVNGLFFLLSAPLIWNPTDAFLLNWAGTIGTGLTSFTFARFFARDWLQKRLPHRVRRFDERLYTHGFRTVFLLRFIFYTTPALQYALGVSRVRFAPFLLGTALGVAPFTLLTTMLGIRANAWLAKHPVSTWPWDRLGPLLVLIAVFVAAIGIVIVRKWRARAVE